MKHSIVKYLGDIYYRVPKPKARDFFFRGTRVWLVPQRIKPFTIVDTVDIHTVLYSDFDDCVDKYESKYCTSTYTGWHCAYYIKGESK